jgi:hypothetical protein
MNYPILLIGFNRPNLLRHRLVEILAQIADRNLLYVYIDGPRGAQDTKSNLEMRKLRSEFSHFSNVQFIFRDHNLGCSRNIIAAITEVCEAHSGVIVIEDDIALVPDFISTISGILDKWDSNSDWLTVGGFSPFVTHNIWVSKVLNRWRKSNYFSAWGWGIRADGWDAFSIVNSTELLEKKLETSIGWQNLGARKQSIWMKRFSRSIWDFQVQMMHFAVDKFCLLPSFRMIDNQGFESELSTHTRHKRPWNFFGNGYSIQSPKIPNGASPKKPSLGWRFVDANLWAADGHFNSRGRSVGLRSSIKKLFKSI